MSGNAAAHPKMNLLDEVMSSPKWDAINNLASSSAGRHDQPLVPNNDDAWNEADTYDEYGRSRSNTDKHDLADAINGKQHGRSGQWAEWSFSSTRSKEDDLLTRGSAHHVAEKFEQKEVMVDPLHDDKGHEDFSQVDPRFRHSLDESTRLTPAPHFDNSRGFPKDYRFNPSTIIRNERRGVSVYAPGYWPRDAEHSATEKDDFLRKYNVHGFNEVDGDKGNNAEYEDLKDESVWNRPLSGIGSLFWIPDTGKHVEPKPTAIAQALYGTGSSTFRPRRCVENTTIEAVERRRSNTLQMKSNSIDAAGHYVDCHRLKQGGDLKPLESNKVIRKLFEKDSRGVCVYLVYAFVFPFLWYMGAKQRQIKIEGLRQGIRRNHHETINITNSQSHSNDRKTKMVRDKIKLELL